MTRQQDAPPAPACQPRSHPRRQPPTARDLAPCPAHTLPARHSPARSLSPPDSAHPIRSRSPARQPRTRRSRNYHRATTPRHTSRQHPPPRPPVINSQAYDWGQRQRESERPSPPRRSAPTTKLRERDPSTDTAAQRGTEPLRLRTRPHRSHREGETRPASLPEKRQTRRAAAQSGGRDRSGPVLPSFLRSFVRWPPPPPVPFLFLARRQRRGI